MIQALSFPCQSLSDNAARLHSAPLLSAGLRDDCRGRARATLGASLIMHI